MLSGPYAAASVDHEAKAVQRLKHRAGNSSNHCSPPNLVSPLVTKLKASLHGGQCCAEATSGGLPCVGGHTHSEIKSATPFQEG